MQHGKCCYCEQKIPKEGHQKAVEHFKPKSIFKYFINDWDNLLLACPQCNGKKSDKFFYEAAVNSISAARAALGLDCPEVVLMDDKILMHSLYSTSGRAVGKIDYFERIYEILSDKRSQYDAVALSSVIKVPRNFHKDYYLEDMLNPWGGVEAMLTHTISQLFDIPSAHSPMLESREILELELGVVDPRKAAEIISVTFLHSILKGLHKNPRIISNPASNNPGVLTMTDISCLIIPDGCVGLPTLAAIEQGIPVIAVRDNKNRMQNKLEDLPFESGKLIVADNYLEAVGIMNAIKSGVSIESVRRPLSFTKVSERNKEEKFMPLNISRGNSGLFNPRDIEKKRKRHRASNL